jgi:hypothetical protein
VTTTPGPRTSAEDGAAPAAVVGLGAWCDYVTEAEYRAELSGPPSSAPTASQHAWSRAPSAGRHLDEALEHFRHSASFRVQEFATLADLRRLPYEVVLSPRLRARVVG